MVGPGIISDMCISDEHVVIEMKKARIKIILEDLRSNPGSAIILFVKKKGIVGVVTSKSISSALKGGKRSRRLRLEDVMISNLLELPSDLPLDDAIEIISEKRPGAVIVRHKDGSFAGYFSSEDYKDAKNAVAAQESPLDVFRDKAQQMIDEATELLDGFSYDAEVSTDEEEDLSYIPVGMRDLPLSPHIKSAFKKMSRKIADPLRKDRAVKRGPPHTTPGDSGGISPGDLDPNDRFPPSTPPVQLFDPSKLQDSTTLLQQQIDNAIDKLTINPGMYMISDSIILKSDLTINLRGVTLFRDTSLDFPCPLLVADVYPRPPTYCPRNLGHKMYGKDPRYHSKPGGCFDMVVIPKDSENITIIAGEACEKMEKFRDPLKGDNVHLKIDKSTLEPCHHADQCGACQRRGKIDGRGSSLSPHDESSRFSGVMVQENARNIEILGLEVLGTISSEYQPKTGLIQDIGTKTRGAITLYQCQEVRVVDCYAHHNDGTAVYVYGDNCENCLIDNCVLSDNGPTGSAISGREHYLLTVTRNVCESNAYSNISINGKYSVVEGNISRWAPKGFAGINIGHNNDGSSASHTECRRNTVEKNATGIIIANSDDVEIEDNNIWYNSGPGIRFLSDGTGKYPTGNTVSMKKIWPKLCPNPKQNPHRSHQYFVPDKHTHSTANGDVTHKHPHTANHTTTPPTSPTLIHTPPEQLPTLCTFYNHENEPKFSQFAAIGYCKVIGNEISYNVVSAVPKNNASAPNCSGIRVEWGNRLLIDDNIIKENDNDGIIVRYDKAYLRHCDIDNLHIMKNEFGKNGDERDVKIITKKNADIKVMMPNDDSPHPMRVVLERNVGSVERPTVMCKRPDAQGDYKEFDPDYDAYVELVYLP